MSFQPNPHDELTLNGLSYRIAEHPAAPGMAHGQEGRAGIVYRLLAPSGHIDQALKVFKPRFRLPHLVTQAERIAPFASLPGLSACQRTVITPARHATLLRRFPDLTYAVLMPWIEGPTWQEVLLEKQPLAPKQSLALAHSLAEALMEMEQQGIAHCDLSAPNLMLPALAPSAPHHPQSAVELIDLEGLYAPGLSRPQELSSGSAGYAHRQAAGGLWIPEADRFAGAVLLVEMLGFCDPQVVEASWGESFFDPQEMHQDSPRYRLLVDSLQRNWGERIASLFARAWHSDTLADCPTFGEWLVTLPEQPLALSTPVGQAERTSFTGQTESISHTDLMRAQVQALLQAAQRMEEQNNLDGALIIYQQALDLAHGMSEGRGLVVEIEAMLREVRLKQTAQQRSAPLSSPVTTAFQETGRQPQTIDRLLSDSAATVDQAVTGETVLQEALLPWQTSQVNPLSTAQRSSEQKTAWGWMWILAGLVILALGGLWVWRQVATLPVLAGTPVPTPAAAISSQTVGSIAQLARWDWTAIYSVAFSPDGTLLASGSWNNTVEVWRVADGALLRMLEGHTERVLSVAFSPDGALLASGSGDNTVKVWRVDDGALLRTLEGFKKWVYSVAFSPDGALLASGAGDKTVKVWRVDDGALLRTLEGHTERVLSVAFSPDGTLLASGSDDNTVRLWRVADGTLVRTLEGGDDVNCIAFSPDGALLASGSWANVKVCRVADGSLVRTLEGEDGWMNSVVFSPDGALLAAGSNNNTVQIWRVADGTFLRTLEGFKEWVYSVAFSPDGTLLASGSVDGTVRLWGVR